MQQRQLGYSISEILRCLALITRILPSDDTITYKSEDNTLMNKLSSELILKFNIKDKLQINKWGHAMTVNQLFYCEHFYIRIRTCTVSTRSREVLFHDYFKSDKLAFIYVTLNFISSYLQWCILGQHGTERALNTLLPKLLQGVLRCSSILMVWIWWLYIISNSVSVRGI